MVFIADEHNQTTKSGADLWGIIANSGEVGEGDNRNDANKINIIQTDIKSQVVPVVLELQWEEHKPVQNYIMLAQWKCLVLPT